MGQNGYEKIKSITWENVVEQLTEEVMQIKSIAMLAVAGCAIGMLTGCGVPQDEHDAGNPPARPDGRAP